MEIRTVSLKNYSAIRIGGEGKIVSVSTLKELIEVLMYAKQEKLRVHVVGLGTNTFFGERMENILCIQMGIRGVSYEEKEETVLLTAYAGEVWDDIVQLSVKKQLWGIENLSYIPGTVGAAPIQNIGAYGAELADTLVSLQAVDTTTFDVVEISKDACNFGYRDSLFKQEKGCYIIVSVTLALAYIPKPVLEYKPLDTLKEKENLSVEDIRELVIATRKSKLPDYRTYPNTGSFFKNPVVTGTQGEALRTTHPETPLIEVQGGFKIPAAWLIEHVAEAKGKRVGDIGTWPNQPLVLVNYGNAQAEELLAFSDEITRIIREKTGQILEREVNYVEG